MPDTRFVLVVPSVGVRREIERARGRTSVSPGHERERADAAPQVVSGLWYEVLRGRGASSASPPPPAMTTTRSCTAACTKGALRHREVEILALDEMLPTGGRSAHDIGFWAKRIQPGPAGARRSWWGRWRECTRTRPKLEAQMARWFPVVTTLPAGEYISDIWQIAGLTSLSNVNVKSIKSAIPLRH